MLLRQLPSFRNLAGSSVCINIGGPIQNLDVRVGRVFLQPDKTDKQKGKYNRVFSEGWVEFMSKKVHNDYILVSSGGLLKRNIRLCRLGALL